MTKKNFTHINIILDRSGSMMSVIPGTISGFNEFIQKQKEDHLDDESCLVSLYQFAEAASFHATFENTDIVDVPDLNNDNYFPTGNSTALFDAIGSTIQNVGNNLSEMPEEERPDSVVVLVLTDGAENSSCEYSQAKIAEMIQHQSNVYSWEFIFMGANQDAVLTASRLSIKAGNSLTYSASVKGTAQAFASAANGLSGKTRSRRMAYSLGASVEEAQAQYKSMDTFFEEDRSEAMEDE
jgi:uncharacterized protein YegL